MLLLRTADNPSCTWDIQAIVVVVVVVILRLVVPATGGIRTDDKEIDGNC
jgi:hypothetical protein